MSEQQEQTSAGKFPQGWHVAADYDPNDHMLNLKGRDYLNVQNRLLWFIKDQRNFIASGVATMPYVIRTELVEMDRKEGFAHFKTYVQDVLGNEATMYGSEAAKDFPDYAEKASTKSLGRALLALGYGTAQAQEMDEGERVVDSPVERKQQARQSQQQQAAPTEVDLSTAQAKPETLNRIAKACEALGIGVPTNIKSEADALVRLKLYSDQWRKQQREATAKAS